MAAAMPPLLSVFFFILHAKIAFMSFAQGRDPKSRFSDRVDDYVKYRPHYASDVVATVRQASGLRASDCIADVGCGTGLLAEIFLQAGNQVIGVEPNEEMRIAGEQYLSAYPGFSMLAGSAEATTLAAGSVDYALAGQAFHWFRPAEARAEFARILRPEGWVVLIWHDRDTNGTPFLRAYEEFILRHAIDYENVRHSFVANYDALQRFFAPAPMQTILQRNRQVLDFDGLRGRLLSSSYIPKSGPTYDAMMAELPELFRTHATDDTVALEYETKIYYGHLTE